MEDLLLLFELALFFILFAFNLRLFKSIRFDLLFKKGHTKEIQLVYIFTVIIFSHLLTRGFMRLFEIVFELR